MFARAGRQRATENHPTLTECEFTDALLSERPSDSLFRWAIEGCLRALVPDLDALRGISQRPAHGDDAFIHTLKVVDAIEPTPVRRWAALLHDIAKAPTYIETPEGRPRFFEHDKIGAEIAGEIMQRFSADVIMGERVQRMVRLHMRPISYNAEWTDSAVRRLCDDVEAGEGEAAWQDQMALSRADLRGYLPEPIDRGLWVLEQLEAHRKRLMQEKRTLETTRPGPPLDGHDLLALAAKEPGPWVAALKDYLLCEVEANRLQSDDRARAVELAREWLLSKG